jgi:hypothetical protein
MLVNRLRTPRHTHRLFVKLSYPALGDQASGDAAWTSAGDTLQASQMIRYAETAPAKSARPNPIAKPIKLAAARKAMSETTGLVIYLVDHLEKREV